MSNENKNLVCENYDAVVVGAGHAGCEAALALSRLGFKTIVFTVSVDSIALMPCNPNIGGSSKGHIVREIDALGGEMGKCIDKTFIQSKMLNKSKGPAVHSLRAQADKQWYTREMRKTLENQENLTIRQAEVSELITEEIGARETYQHDSENVGESRSPSVFSEHSEGSATKHSRGASHCKGELNMPTPKKIIGVKTVSGATYFAKTVVLATGVYLNARCLYGDVIEYTGPNGLKSANHLTDSLLKEGITIKRFKTGTPARIDKRSLDFSKMEEQFGDVPIVPFSFSTDPEKIQKEQVSCYLTYTNEVTHDIIRKNIDRSPLFSGVIEGTGPRYCPSIEDKVMKFPDKDRHQIFVEPEGLYTNEMYLSGMSSSLPEDVQHKIYRTMPGFENAVIVRNAYAIEYDLIDSTELKPSLELKNIEGLFCAGQINGSSGYEEAAGQGLMAGINASRLMQGKEAIILKRSDGYIGVLIDDLVTKDTTEPYRMMTSRAEYRLLLRQDNADLRLTEIGYEIGLVSKERLDYVNRKKEMIKKEVDRLKNTHVGVNEKINTFLKEKKTTELLSGVTLAELCKRPELSYQMISEIDEGRPELPRDVLEQVGIEIKYEGYIAREMQQVESFKKMENKKIPKNFDYDKVKNLRIEARQKLKKYRPENIGMASRISGVSPADISVLLVFLKS
ncbi:MAG: tRNA uridine-5-carboxymethylaminomethyl(34) synthesis enzyme MnmG [Lachnospiraceae bacterium]|nr:tRNA uridine-5-carboxymethylaminomethyl(34) synthesis enzyme MnmG [Lachnospiraceae bacterium]